MAIAKSLSEILKNPIVEGAMDRTTDILPIINTALDQWQVDLYKLNPSPSRDEDGEFIGTDLSFYHFQQELERTRAVLVLPEHERHRAKATRSDQEIISEKDRRGEYGGLVSNQETLAFSIRLIKDYNVIEFDGRRYKVGVPRNFTIINDFGAWHSGWKGFEFIATEGLTDFIEEKGIEIEPERLNFRYFVPPQMAYSFFGSKYITAKILDERITEQKKREKRRRDTLRAEGVRLGGRMPPKIESEQEESTSTKGKVLEAIITHPEFTGDYKIRGMTWDRKTIDYAHKPEKMEDKRNVLRYSVHMLKKLWLAQRQIRAHYKAVELAFYLNAFDNNDEYTGKVRPSWGIPEMIEHKRKRTRYNALNLNDEVRLLWRVYEKKTRRSK